MSGEQKHHKRPEVTRQEKRTSAYSFSTGFLDDGLLDDIVGFG